MNTIQILENRQLLSIPACSSYGQSCEGIGFDLNSLPGQYCAPGNCFVMNNYPHPSFNDTTGNEFCAIASNGACVNPTQSGTTTLLDATGPTALVIPNLGGGGYSLEIPDGWAASVGGPIYWYYLADMSDNSLTVYGQSGEFSLNDTGMLFNCLGRVTNDSSPATAFQLYNLGGTPVEWNTSLGCIGVDASSNGVGVYEGCYDGDSYLEAEFFGNNFQFVGNIFNGFGELPFVFSVNAINGTEAGAGNLVFSSTAKIGAIVTGQTVGCSSGLGYTILGLSPVIGNVTVSVEYGASLTGPNFGFGVDNNNQENYTATVDLSASKATLTFTAFNVTQVNVEGDKVNFAFNLNYEEGGTPSFYIQDEQAASSKWPNVNFFDSGAFYAKGGEINGLDFALIPE